MTLLDRPIWHRDYSDYTVDVFSPELPTGVAWLTNCFLELNIPAWQPWGIDVTDEWQRLSPYHYHYQDQQNLWQQTLPALKQGRHFEFDRRDVICFSHHWPFHYHHQRKLIIFVRNPRDVLYSQWRREKYNTTDFNLSFEAFIQSQYYHYPLSYRDYLMLYLELAHVYLSQCNYMVVRFEDYKNNAAMTLEQVLAYLSIDKSDESIETAVRESDFSVVKKAEDALQKKGLLKKKYNHSGQVNEYKSLYTEQMTESLGRVFNASCQRFGYALFNEDRPLDKSHYVSDDHIHAIIKAMNIPSNASIDLQVLFECIKLNADKIQWRYHS